MSAHPTFRRILLKLSGESLMGSQKFGIEEAASHRIAVSVKEILQLGVQVAIVIGGGNLFRGIKGLDQGIARNPADQIGMLATLINGIALQQAFEKIGISSHVMSAVACTFLEAYHWETALRYLDQNKVLIFVGGTGNPYFTTDSAAALRALEMKAQVVMKATKVSGVYNKDPVKFSDAVKYDKVTYAEVLEKQLGVMDAAAIALCRENRIPICVFNIFEDQTLKLAVCGQPVGTIVE